MTSSPHVFIASVPWRQANLEELLRRLPPVPTTVLLDGYAATPRARGHVEFRNVIWGAGERWRAASEKDDALAIVLDDDFLVDYPYVDRCVSAYERIRAPFAWAGVNRQGVYVKSSKIGTKDIEITMLAAGHAVVPSNMLRGMFEHPDAAYFLGRHGHDEAFVSFWLRRQSKIFRPAGASGLVETKLHYDKRSQWRTDPRKYDRLKKELEPMISKLGKTVAYYAGGTGKVIDARRNGCVRVHWSHVPNPEEFESWWYGEAVHEV